MEKKKSKKDLAFEKERISFRRQIRELTEQLSSEKRKYSDEIEELQKKLDGSEEELRKMKEWNDRLLEYMDLSKEEMRIIIKKDKTVAKICNNRAAINAINAINGGR